MKDTNTQPVLVYMLFVLFVGLKLTGHIAWSWWWVFAPLWLYVVLTMAVGFVIGFIAAYRKSSKAVQDLDGRAGR